MAQQSCPTTCPLKKNGCYAELNKAGLHTWRLNREAARRRKSLKALRQLMAAKEAEAILSLTGKRKLRVHVVGDCATAASARLIGQAMRAHEAKYGKAAWSYTHAWRTVPIEAWQGARVLASCERVDDVAEARKRGYATSLIVPPHPTPKIYTYETELVLPCPAQFTRNGSRFTTCEQCNACQRPDWLRGKPMSIGFQPDGNTEKRVMKLLEVR